MGVKEWEGSPVLLTIIFFTTRMPQLCFNGVWQAILVKWRPVMAPTRWGLFGVLLKKHLLLVQPCAGY